MFHINLSLPCFAPTAHMVVRETYTQATEDDMVRRITGLPLPICMKVGKLAAQGTYAGDFVAKLPTYFKAEGWQCGDRCCGGTRYTLTGPKGSIESDYGFHEEDITKEYAFYLHKQNNPPGTPFYPQK